MLDVRNYNVRLLSCIGDTFTLLTEFQDTVSQWVSWMTSPPFILQQRVTILASTSQTSTLMSRSHPFNPAGMSTCKLHVKTEKQSMAKAIQKLKQCSISSQLFNLSIQRCLSGPCRFCFTFPTVVKTRGFDCYWHLFIPRTEPPCSVDTS